MISVYGSGTKKCNMKQYLILKDYWKLVSFASHEHVEATSQDRSKFSTDGAEETRALDRPKGDGGRTGRSGEWALDTCTMALNQRR